MTRESLFLGLVLQLLASGPSSAEPTILEPSQETFRDWPPSELRTRPYWLTWGKAAFDRAALFDRPVFFMLDAPWSAAARRTLEGALADERVVAELNAGFVTIRADADLWPEVRERYQTGAWPTLAFLLPDGNPMVSTRNDSRADQPITLGAVDAETLLFLVREGAKYWSLAGDELIVRGRLWSASEGPLKPLLGVVDADASDKLAYWMEINADVSDGGFGAAPKFVVPYLFEFASVRGARGSPDLLDHALLSIERLLESPLFDREGGGVRRIATAPSFEGIESEKMLGVNAALVRELTFALRAGGAPELRAALESTTGFITTGLARPEGGFYLAWIPGESGGAEPQVVRTLLSGPNAMAGAALLRAAALLGDVETEVAGTAALEMVIAQAIVPGKGIRHSLQPSSGDRVYLEALADAAFGLVDAYESTGRAPYLEAARSLVDQARLTLDDPESGAYFDHPAGDDSVGLLANPRRPLRPNARLARTMIRLDLHGAGSEYRDAAAGILSYFCGNLSGFRAHATEAALAVEEMVSDPVRIRIDGPPGQIAPRALRAAALQVSWPWTVVGAGDAAARPSAEVSWRGKRQRLYDPAKLDGIVASMTGGAAR